MVRKIARKWRFSSKNEQKEDIIPRILTLITPLVKFANNFGLRDAIDFSATQFIHVYQNYLSPRKGFSCAYTKLHGRESCSEYFRLAVKQYGVAKAIPLFRQRLRDCKQAHTTLKARCRCKGN
jgi:putative component of membrane protein insertase Oxa1/YidC/SpoIIIJ protein YidD